MPRHSSLAFVRQIQSLAENVELLREQACLAQVASILDRHIEHPDCHTRHAAASALATLSRRCTTDEWQSLELPTTRRMMTESQLLPAEQAGSLDSFHEFLISIMHDSEQPNGPLMAGEGRGEVRMEIIGSHDLSQEVRVALLQAVVNVEGAVSATCEHGQLVVVTLTPPMARSNRFLSDICQTIRDHVGEGSQVLHLDASLETARDQDEPCYLDDSLPDSMENSSDEEPAYLDDEEDGDEEGSAKLISCDLARRHAWLAGERLQEFDDDPTLVARLRKARQKLEKKRSEEHSRVQRLFSIMTPLRVLAGARRCTSDSTSTISVQDG
eukprot:TRINITY_DN42539_c0_g1_i1.p1 TRINITY_DN42539_c0_g1~~TRINITY_DN42539_c0_g1_i1.p1  ORF type:complete len:327 (-),score=51.33 TRINITY_DN42539_c0_g1_i1:90-1070(-)